MQHKYIIWMIIFKCTAIFVQEKLWKKDAALDVEFPSNFDICSVADTDREQMETSQNDDGDIRDSKAALSSGSVRHAF